LSLGLQNHSPALVKQFFKALDPNSAALNHIRITFPHLSDTKLKGGTVTEPQIRVMLSSQCLEQTMTVVERNAWEAFRMAAIIAKIIKKQWNL
jgi:hypothetical protein